MVPRLGEREHTIHSMLKKARLLTRPTLARRDAPYPMQGCSERGGERRTLRYVELLSEARTPLTDFFSILLVGEPVSE